MMKKTILFTSAILFLFMLGSCRKEPLELINPNELHCNTFVSQFETLWHGIDQSYLFWEIDTVDWDARYQECLPIFEEFDSRSGEVTQQEYQDAYARMFRGLMDHHLYMKAQAPKGSASAYVSPGDEELRQRPGYHNRWDERELEIAALKKLDTSRFASWDGDDPNTGIKSVFTLLPGKDGKKIAYLRFSGFQLSEMYNRRDRVKKAAMEPLKRFYGSDFGNGIGADGWAASSEVEGIIIDLRCNGGGYVSDITPFIGSLMQDNYHWGYSRVKEGIGRLDYSAWTEFWVRAHSRHIPSGKRIVVLADCRSVSCAEISTQIIKHLPNGTFIGERTYGATCPLSNLSQEMFYSGSFGDENLNKVNYYVYTSFMYFVDADHQSLEGRGVTPDIEVPFDRDALERGVDVQLNAALEFLRK